MIGLGIIFINAFIVFRNKNYERIDMLFVNESKKKRILGIGITILYVISTIVFFTICLVYLNKHPIKS